MARVSLTHLTFLGTNVEPATVEFGPEATLVRGPSDTGKSFIVDSIDFMLGSNALKEIPERQGYSTALLGLLLPSGDAVTLSRSVNGGNIGLYPGDIRSGALPVPPETLGAKHNPNSDGNLSMFLLTHVGLDGRRVRKNVRNETDSLSFRNVAHLCSKHSRRRPDDGLKDCDRGLSEAARLRRGDRRSACRVDLRPGCVIMAR